jgi:2-phosphoglycerate kinase
VTEPTVLLLGGASGVGKSQVASGLASRFGASVVAVDDFQVVLERMTSPERYPELHRWRLHPEEVLALDDDGMLAHTRGYAEVIADALEAVIGNHLESGPPIVLEGDFILPSLAIRRTYDGVAPDGRVRAVFLIEEDEDQLAHNFLTREGGPQSRRARASWCYGEWLRRECERLGVPAISSRPWETSLARAVGAVSEQAV